MEYARTITTPETPPFARRAFQADRVRLLAQHLGLTLPQLAARAGAPALPKATCNAATARYHPALAEACGVPLAWLNDGVDAPAWAKEAWARAGGTRPRLPAGRARVVVDAAALTTRRRVLVAMAVRGLRAADLARALGVSASFVSSALRTRPGTSLVAHRPRLAEVLGVPEDWLARDDDAPVPAHAAPVARPQAALEAQALLTRARRFLGVACRAQTAHDRHAGVRAARDLLDEILGDRNGPPPGAGA